MFASGINFNTDRAVIAADDIRMNLRVLYLGCDVLARQPVVRQPTLRARAFAQWVHQL